jgi:hypothetical protein
MSSVKRPGFVRVDTDRAQGPSDSKNNYELQDRDSENGADGKVNQVSSGVEGEDLPAYEGVRDGAQLTGKAETAADIVTKVIHAEDDDPNMPCLTFRTFFIGEKVYSIYAPTLTWHIQGLGLSAFGSVLQEIFYFKPQTIFVSLVFLTVWAYILGDFMAWVIPRKGFLRYLNPHPFNSKEHAAITIMASAAAQSALATEALAAQELFYGGYPSRAAGIFTVLTR